MKEVPTIKLKGKSKSPKTIFFITIIIILVIFIITVNIINYNREIPLSLKATLLKEDIEYILTSEKSDYSSKEPVKLIFKVKNQSTEKTEIEFDTEEEVEFIVEEKQNYLIFHPKLVIWKSSFGKIYQEKPTKITLMGKEEKIYTGLWEQIDYEGKKVGPGSFIISALFKNKENTPPLSINVVTGEE